MNARDLTDEEILEADFVFISAKMVQAKSANDLIERCKALNAKTVACGSLFTNSNDYSKKVDHLLLEEAEIILPQFLNDLNEGNAKHKYPSNSYTNITPAY